MTKQELNCVMTIIDLVKDYSKKFYEGDDLEDVLSVSVLKRFLTQAFDEEKEGE